MPNEFVIFCTARTGSYSLVSRLNSAPDIVCHGEIFKQKAIEVEPGRKRQLARFATTEARNADPVGYIRDLRDLDPNQHFGFKFFAQHQRWADIRSYLKAPETKRVILYRDPIGAYGSLLRAKSSGEWLLTGKPKEAPKARWSDSVFALFSAGRRQDREGAPTQSMAHAGSQTKAHFTPESFDRFMNAYGNFAKRCVQLSKLDNSFVIDYKQINEEAVVDGLLKFLGSSAKFAETATELNKQHRGSDADGFDNWDALKEYIEKTGRRIRAPRSTCR